MIFESRTGNAEMDYVWLNPDAGQAESYSPIATIAPGTAAVSALHFDRLGTPLKATNASQTIVYALAMNPNGAGTPSPVTLPVALRWPGQINDNTGMFNNGYRTYLDFTFPSYLQPDPIGLAGGLNPYIYGGMNPFKLIDPNGENPLLLAALVGGAFYFSTGTANAPGPNEAVYPSITDPQRLLNAAIATVTGQVAGKAIGFVAGRVAGALAADTAELITPGAACTVSDAPSSLQAFRLGQQLAAEQAAGTSAPTSITNYSAHFLDQIAGRDAGIGVSQSALEDAFANPKAIQYAPSRYGPTFRYVGNDATVVVNPQGNSVTGWATNRFGSGR